jgi:hypothetical protein
MIGRFRFRFCFRFPISALVSLASALYGLINVLPVGGDVLP